MKEIKLTQGKVALVDDEDFEELNKHKWHTIKCKGIFYAFRQEYEKSKHKRRVLMHREILPIKTIGNVIDHIDLNGLNNQKTNLRECSISQNNMNKSIYKNKKTKYKGVHVGYKSKKGQSFNACISINGRNLHLGVFLDEIEAAKAYDKAALEHYGKFSNINFPKQ